MAEDSENEVLLTEIPAREILDLIKKDKPIEYDHVRIKGELDLSELDLPIEDVDRTEYQTIALWLPEESKVISTSIKITNSKFDSKVNFGNILFKGRVHLSNIIFGKEADFSGATFTEYANFNGATFSGHANFSGATFSVYADYSGATNFSRAIFSEYADFRTAIFSGDADFREVTFVEYADFSGVTFSGYADFRTAIFSEGASFGWVTFSQYVHFIKSTFGGDACFIRAIFGGDAYFIRATFSGDARFDRATFSESAEFSEAAFNEKANFAGSQFKGDDLTFESAIFKDPKSQEEACRRAKNVLEKNGNREDADYHFYREMEAKRKQKLSGYEDFDYEALLFSEELRKETNLDSKKWGFINNISNIFEYILLQKIFGYGVHPFWLWGWWFFFVGIFAVIYWLGKGVNNATTAQPLTNQLEYIWFSITVAVTPGFAGNKPATGVYQVIAGLEAIFGTFMWAAFVTTFGKKFMR